MMSSLCLDEVMVFQQGHCEPTVIQKNHKQDPSNLLHYLLEIELDVLSIVLTNENGEAKNWMILAWLLRKCWSKRTPEGLHWRLGLAANSCHLPQLWRYILPGISYRPRCPNEHPFAGCQNGLSECQGGRTGECVSVMRDKKLKHEEIEASLFIVWMVETRIDLNLCCLALLWGSAEAQQLLSGSSCHSLNLLPAWLQKWQDSLVSNKARFGVYVRVCVCARVWCVLLVCIIWTDRDCMPVGECISWRRQLPLSLRALARLGVEHVSLWVFCCVGDEKTNMRSLDMLLLCLLYCCYAPALLLLYSCFTAVCSLEW